MSTVQSTVLRFMDHNNKPKPTFITKMKAPKRVTAHFKGGQFH